MFHGHLDYLGGKSNTKLRDHGVQNAHDRWFILFYHMWGPAWIGIHSNIIWLRARHIWLHITLEGRWPHYMMLEVGWDGLRTLSLWLSQYHGHGSWLVCEVTLSVEIADKRLWASMCHVASSLLGGQEQWHIIMAHMLSATSFLSQILPSYPTHSCVKCLCSHLHLMRSWPTLQPGLPCTQLLPSGIRPAA